MGRVKTEYEAKQKIEDSALKRRESICIILTCTAYGIKPQWLTRGGVPFEMDAYQTIHDRKRDD